MIEEIDNIGKIVTPIIETEISTVGTKITETIEEEDLTETMVAIEIETEVEKETITIAMTGTTITLVTVIIDRETEIEDHEVC